MKHQERFIWFDLIRGLSALAVCASHLRSATMVDFPKIQGHVTLIQKVLYFITGLGHESVMVFFVLSGFFVGGSVLKAGNKFTLSRYALTRLTRLWVVLIPALIVTAVVDQLILMHSPSVLEGSFYSLWNSGPAPGKEYSSSLMTFFGNIVFLQTITIPVFGVNGPLWSLASEFWYYVLFPACLIIFTWGNGKPYASGQSKVFCALVILSLAFFLPHDIWRGYLIWLLGVVVFISMGKVSNKTSKLLAGVGFCFFLFSLIYSKSGMLKVSLGLPVDELVGVSFTTFCIGIVNLKSSINANGLLSKLSSSLSEFSYSLYLVHFPFVVMIASYLYGADKLEPNLNGLLQFGAWMLLLVLIGVAFWWLFERKTNQIRKYISELIFTKN